MSRAGRQAAGKEWMAARRLLPPLLAVVALLSIHADCGAADRTGIEAGTGIETETETSRRVSVDDARRLLSQGNASGALTLLRQAMAADPDDPDAAFVLGMAALTVALGPAPPGGGPWTEEARTRLLDEAAAAFRGMLAKRPDLPRPRLELARVLFERGRCNEPASGPGSGLLRQLARDDCEAAAHHFRRVLAGGPPRAVVANVDRFLAAIRSRKRLSADLSLAVAPDTNVNSAPEAETVEIFGLPFRLDEDARASSGVGLIVSGAVRYQRPLAIRPFASAAAARARFGAALHRREYAGSRFDDMTLTLHGGPRLLFRRSDLSLLAVSSRRWLANDTFSRGLGLRLEGGHRPGNRLWVGGRLEAVERSHLRPFSRLDGPRLDASLAAAFRPGPAARLRAHGGWRRARTDSPFERYDSRWAGASVEWDLPRTVGVDGFGLEVSHRILLREYDRARPILHPEPRADRLRVSRLTVYNRTLDLRGFTPMLSLVHEDQESNIVLHEYRRNRLEAVLRRRF